MEQRVVVDGRGFFVGVIQWDPEVDTKPSLNRGQRAAARMKHMLPIDVFENGCQRWRWSFEEERWQKPNRTYYRVGPNGNLLGAVKSFKERLPGLKLGEQWTTKEPPESPNRRPVFRDGEWRFPARFALVAADGTVKNRVCAMEADSVQKEADDDEVVDEAEFDEPLSPRDKVDSKAKTMIEKFRRSPKVKVRMLQKQLKGAGLLASFTQFLKDNDLDLADLEDEVVKVDTKLLADWAATEGLSRDQVIDLLSSAKQKDDARRRFLREE